MITMNRDTVINDFKWVIRVLDSSENRDHMSTTLKCFDLWESKHNSKSLKKDDKEVITELKRKFWSKFVNKFTNFGTTNI